MSGPTTGQTLEQVGDFELITKLGQGAMGAVFKARQRMLDRIVALKVLPPRIAKDQDFIQRFVREARASAKLSHPNIVAGIDVGQDEATKLWYFAMEFVDGPTVKQMQEKNAKLPEDQALKIARDVAMALDCAHQAGMVHRDVKPDNILIMSDGTAKLADLGLARQAREDSSLTQSGQAMGTPHYMAPEQARGENETLNTRADLYALGATLFHMVTGKTPFTGETAAVIMAKHLTDPPPAAHRVNPEVSQGCSRLILRLMQKDPAKRYQTPSEVVAQIDRLLLLPAEARATTTGPRRVVKTGPHGMVRGTTAAQDVVRGRRKRDTGEAAPVSGEARHLPLVLGGVAGLIVVVIAAFALFGGDKPQRVTQTNQQPPANGGPNKVVGSTPANTPTPTKKQSDTKPPAANNEHRSDPVDTQEQEPLPKPPPPVQEVVTGGMSGDRPIDTVPPIEHPLPPPPTGTQPDPPTAPEPEPTKAVSPAQEAAGANSKAAKAAYRTLVKEMNPLLEKNRFDDALALLDEGAAKPELKESAKRIEQEKADIKAVAALRDETIKALQAKVGAAVELRIGKQLVTGTVKKQTQGDAVSLDFQGAQMSIGQDQLHAEDVKRHAPGARKAEDFRIRGLLFLYAGDLDKAKEYLKKADIAGSSEESLQLYLDRIAAFELGARQAEAVKAWKQAEELFAQKKLKEAKAAYLAFIKEHGKSTFYAKRAASVERRLAAIADASKPKITFVAEKSMQVEPVGTKHFEPRQETDDATVVFQEKAVYFNQRTGKDVVYRVVSPVPLTGLRWKGAAMTNMTIDVLDAQGNSLGKGGPYNGGNRWAEYVLPFKPSTEFTLRISNHATRWYLIAELELYPEGQSLPEARTFEPPDPPRAKPPRPKKPRRDKPRKRRR